MIVLTLARKPLEGTVARNVSRFGTGVMNVDACRIPYVTINGGNLADNPHLRTRIRQGARIAPSSYVAGWEESFGVTHPGGRFPANVLLGFDVPCVIAHYFRKVGT